MQADRVLYNGTIYTLWDEQPQVTAVAMFGGRIVAVGNDVEMLALAGADTQRDDLKGATVLPGFIDAHVHWRWTSENMHSVDVYEVTSLQAALDAVAERVAQVEPGEWVRGHGWAQDFWEGRAFPTAADLDAVAPDNPVYLTAKSAHAAWVNTAALERAGITSETPDPDGGEIMHDADGKPTGILLENPAMQLVALQIPKLTTEKIAEQMLTAQQKALSEGLTAVHDLDDPDCLAGLQVLRERGELGLRVTKYINKPYLDAAIESGIRTGFGDAWLRFAGLKLFADGALGPRTALMLEPYEGEPDNYGIVVTPKDEMLRLTTAATLNGLPTAIHAIGDKAIRDVLDVFEQVRATEVEHGIPRAARRHRIEHVQVIHPDDVNRLAELDIIASMQPIHATSDAETADRYWGERAALSYNIRRQIHAGARVALGSDSPIEPFNPLFGIYAAVTRQHLHMSLGEDGWRPDAKLTMDEAIRGYTTGAAYAAGLEHEQGRLAPGYYADAVVLDRDLYTIDPKDMLETQVLGTLVDGVWRFGGVW